jgi:hypothetical protein
MTADEPLFELADVGLARSHRGHETGRAVRPPMRLVRGRCRLAPAEDQRLLGLCPSCGSDAGGNPAESSTWWRQRLPLAGIAPLGLAARAGSSTS